MNNVHAMTLKNNSSKNHHAKILEFLSEFVSGFEAIMIVDKEGNLTEYNVSKKFKREHHVQHLKRIAKKISLRFPMAGFYKELGGLKITVNLFKKQAVIVCRLLKSNCILIVICPKQPIQIASTLAILDDQKKWI